MDPGAIGRIHRLQPGVTPLESQMAGAVPEPEVMSHRILVVVDQFSVAKPALRECLSPGTLALTFVCQSWEQLEETPQNVVIVVISLQQKHLRMTTVFGAKSDLKQLLSPSALANDDVVNFDATPFGLKGQNKSPGHVLGVRIPN